MSTALEDRLAAALHARAELVQPEEIGHAAPQPRTPTPLWRRPAVVALVAAAAVAAVAVPVLLLGGHGDHRPVPSDRFPVPSHRFPVPTPDVAHSLSGDVDGDGHPDRIRESGHTLTVTLAADPSHPLTQSDRHLVGLAGLADVGSVGQGILTVRSDVSPNWGIEGLRNGRLHVIAQSSSIGNEGAGLGVAPGLVTSWITPAGVPMSGLLDPMQHGARHLAVRASRFVPRHGSLAAVDVGTWCWDVVAQHVPAPCSDGVDNAFDPGPHGSLPALLPRVSSEDYADEVHGWHEGSTALDVVEGAVKVSSFLQQGYDVRGTIDGHEVSAPAGFATPTLVKKYVDLGHGVRGIAVIDNSKSTWNLLAFVDGRLVPLSVSGEVLPTTDLGLVLDGKVRRAETWMGPDGQVFTRVQTGGPGQFHVYEWQVTDSSGTRLEPVDVGTACIDDFWGTYGTCSS